MFTVRITQQGSEPYLWENSDLPVENFDLAKDWARKALRALPDVVSAEVVTAPLTREQVYARWEDAISAHGEVETFETIDKIVSSGRNLTLRVKVSRMEKHPAFQLLHRGSEEDPRGQWLINEFMRGRYAELPETDVRALDVDEQIQYLMRRLLSTLAVLHNKRNEIEDMQDERFIRPLGKNAEFKAWIAVIHKLRAIYHPQETKEVSRPEREARRQANRTERLAAQPAKGTGKGGKSKS